MEIKELCDRITELYENPDIENQERGLAVRLIYQLQGEIKAEEFSNNDLIPILETTTKICSTKRNLKQVLENELLSLITYLPHKLWMKQSKGKSQYFEKDSQNREWQIAQSLIDFSKKIYEINLDRDSFAGKRRGYSIQILESLSNYFDIPEFMELCLKSLKSKSKNEFLDSIECLKEYYKEKNIVPTEDVISIIDKRIEKTKHRVEATGGLILQVETGLISELSALSRLDDWKEKNDRW